MMSYRNNIYVGIFFLLFGLFLIFKGKYYDLSFTIYGPKIIFSLIFVIVGILIIRNYFLQKKIRHKFFPPRWYVGKDSV